MMLSRVAALAAVLVALISVAAFVVTPTACQAGSYDMRKRITWDISGELVNDKYEPMRDHGQYKQFVHTFAACDCSLLGHILVDHNDAPDAAELNDEDPIVEYDGVLYSGYANGQVDRKDHAFWSLGVPYHQDDGVDPPELARVSVVPHAGGRAGTKIRVDPFRYKGIRPISTAEIHVWGNAKAEKCPNGRSYSDAASAGAIWIAGEVKKVEMNEGGKWKDAKGLVVDHWLQLGGSTQAAAWDPIKLSILDAVDGTLLAEQDLWDEDYATAGEGTLAWDETAGLVMSAGISDEVSVSFATLSDWVVNPFTGSASIVDGVFTATGDMEALPWTLSDENGILTASLTPSVFAASRELLIQADLGVLPANDTIAAISGGVGGYTAAAVPEPSSAVAFAIMLMGSVPMLRRRK